MGTLTALATAFALLAAPAFAQSNPIGGAGGAGLVSSYTTPGNAYYGRPLPRTMSGWPVFVAPAPCFCSGSGISPDLRFNRRWDTDTGYDGIQLDYD